MPLKVIEESQVYRLREKLQEAGVGHLQQMVGNIPNLRVTSNQVFFCYIPEVAVATLEGMADGEELPWEATIEGFEGVPDGFYNLRNVQIVTNGRIALTKLPETEMVLVRG